MLIVPVAPCSVCFSPSRMIYAENNVFLVEIGNITSHLSSSEAYFTELYKKLGISRQFYNAATLYIAIVTGKESCIYLPICSFYLDLDL